MTQRRNKNISHLAANAGEKGSAKGKGPNQNWSAESAYWTVFILYRGIIYRYLLHTLPLYGMSAAKRVEIWGPTPSPKATNGAGLTLERPSLAVIRRRGRGMCGAEEPLGRPISARLSAQRSRGATTKRKSAGWYLETGLGPNARSLLLHSTLAPCTPAWCLAGVCRLPRRHFLGAAIPFKTMPRPPWQPSILLFPTNRHHEVRYRPVSSPATLEVCSGASLLSGAFRFCC